MSLTCTFNLANPGRHAGTPAPRKRPKAPAPFSLRLTDDERARLVAEAGGTPLGSYIKSKLFATAPSGRPRSTGLAVMDRDALARLLALLGGSQLASSLGQLAYAASIGALPATAVETDLAKALLAVKDMRRLLVTALGLKPDSAP